MSGRNETKADKERQKQIHDKCQSVLNQLLRDEDNKYCVDCDAKGPRWASWNLGIFLCIRCAGIHRNLGVHISKVKSVNLDTWTPEQVVSLQQMGNSRARAVYEATVPDTWRRPQTNTSLETFIRAKYQHKKYIAKEWVPPPLPEINWEKEIEEEAENQKRKKKEKQQQLTSGLPPVKKVDVAVPALPKPSSSPKSSRAPTSSTEKPSSTAVDLLGLSMTMTNHEGSDIISTSTSGGNSDDIFSSFLSAPVSTTPVQTCQAAPKVEANELSAEENSFFNQPAPAMASDSKKTLSKDSIMALYSSQVSVPPQPTMFHSPGIFPSNPAMSFPGTTNSGFPSTGNVGFPHSGFQAGLMQTPVPALGAFPPTAISSPFANGVQSIPASGPNPFFGMALTMPPTQGFTAQHGSQTNPSDDLLVDFATPSGSLQEQMTGLNLGGTSTGPVMGACPPFSMINQRPAPAMGQTFTTQLWQ